MDAEAIVFVIITHLAMAYILYDALRDRGVL
jgi:hypothetical protein